MYSIGVVRRSIGVVVAAAVVVLLLVVLPQRRYVVRSQVSMSLDFVSDD